MEMICGMHNVVVVDSYESVVKKTILTAEGAANTAQPSTDRLQGVCNGAPLTPTIRL